MLFGGQSYQTQVGWYTDNICIFVDLSNDADVTKVITMQDTTTSTGIKFIIKKDS